MANSRKSVSIDARTEALLARQVATGRYKSASDVIFEGLRLLQDRDGQLEHLRSEIDIADQEIVAGAGREFLDASDLISAIKQLERDQSDRRD
jgi:antitoxin ParD1/3/4